jgi:hypothetical protein
LDSFNENSVGMMVCEGATAEDGQQRKPAKVPGKSGFYEQVIYVKGFSVFLS